MSNPALAAPSADMVECLMDTPSGPTPLNTRGTSDRQAVVDYSRIEKAIRFLSENRFEQPELALIAAEVGLSEYHLQRLFSRWAGISPKKFLQYLTLSHAKQRLSESASVLDTTFDVGLSGPGRLHDLFVNFSQVTPGEYKSRGAGLEFRYGYHPTPFGDCLAVVNTRGLSGLSFVVNMDRASALAEQKAGWDRALWVEDPRAGQGQVAQLFKSLGQATADNQPISVLLRGSAFQVQVWQALLQIPTGCTVTYGGLAERMGKGRKSARALGNACGANRIGVLIPCHRVIRDIGAVTGYRWGPERKKALLAFEAAKTENPNSVVL